jgi:hypothetical protein
MYQAFKIDTACPTKDYTFKGYQALASQIRVVFDGVRNWNFSDLPFPVALNLFKLSRPDQQVKLYNEYVVNLFEDDRQKAFYNLLSPKTQKALVKES